MAEDKRASRKRDAQLNVRLDKDLYEDYKALLSKEDISLTEDIEEYIKGKLGKINSRANVIDIGQVLEKHQQEIEELKIELGKLKAG
jgi:hypothetical protein